VKGACEGEGRRIKDEPKREGETLLIGRGGVVGWRRGWSPLLVVRRSWGYILRTRMGFSQLEGKPVLGVEKGKGK